MLDAMESGSAGALGTREPAADSIYAALDLGTNNCRLLIASAGEGRETFGNLPVLKVLDSFSRIVRLGEGVTHTGNLSPEAMERTLSALQQCKKKLSRYRVTHARFVATEACRRAANGQAFMERVRQETGLPIEIISNEEEAKLAFLGCSSLLSLGLKRAVVFDIGGGSTEFLWVDVEKEHARAAARRGTETLPLVNGWTSIPNGVMNLADRFGGQAHAEMAFADMVQYFIGRLRPFDEANDISRSLADGRVQLLSTSGTVTTLAAIHLDLPRYDRSRIDGITLDVADIRRTTQKLLAMRPSERFNHPCIGPDRADFIISGCAIFEAISTLWPASSITIADRGVREGIIMSLMHPHG